MLLFVWLGFLNFKSEVVEVGQNPPNLQNMLLDDFVFSLQGLFIASSPFPAPYTFRYSALRSLLRPTKGNGRREFGLWRGPGGTAVISCRGCGRWFGTDGLVVGSVGRRKKNAENITAVIG